MGKGQPRFARQTGRAYTPVKTRKYEADVEVAARSVMAGRSPFECAVFMKVVAYLRIPESASKARKAAMLSGAERPTKKPDGTNIFKAVEDALNGVVFFDDSQVVGQSIQKFWSEDPRIEVWVGPIRSGDLA